MMTRYHPSAPLHGSSRNPYASNLIALRIFTLPLGQNPVREVPVPADAFTRGINIAKDNLHPRVKKY